MPDDLPTLRVIASRQLVGWEARVTESGELIASCSHRHRTIDRALLCGDKLARDILIRRVEENSHA